MISGLPCGTALAICNACKSRCNFISRPHNLHSQGEKCMLPPAVNVVATTYYHNNIKI